MNKLLQATGRYLRNVEQLMWHNYCRCCKAVISHEDEYFCSACSSRLGLCFVDSFCKRCGRENSSFGSHNSCPKCEDEVYHFDSIACAGVYNSPLSDLIVMFKLSDQTTLLPILSDFTRKSLSRAAFISEVDYFVPVPMYWLSKLHRGFNQSYLIAKNLKIPGVQVNTDLIRIRNTKSQTSVSFAERRKNLLNAFTVRKNHSFSGKNICLIDDVKTTGATLNECSKILKQAGAAKVFAFVLAVAGQGK